MYTLKNKLLVSMPNMTDPYFAKSVIFICEYNDDGAVGFIINKPVSTMKIIRSGIKDKFFKDLLSQSNKIYFGGPVSIHEAWMLSAKNTKNISFDMSVKTKLSNDLELIKKILFEEKKLDNTKLIFGHSAWDKNQLDNEIKNGDWLLMPADDNFIFSISNSDKWQKAASQFGIDILDLGGSAGLA